MYLNAQGYLNNRYQICRFLNRENPFRCVVETYVTDKIGLSALKLKELNEYLSIKNRQSWSEN